MLYHLSIDRKSELNLFTKKKYDHGLLDCIIERLFGLFNDDDNSEK